MAMTKRAVLLLLLVGLFALASCDRGLFGDDLPSESVVVDIDLEPGANETYEFEFRGRSSRFVQCCVSEPALYVLHGWGAHQRWWARDGVEQVDWPGA